MDESIEFRFAEARLSEDGATIVGTALRYGDIADIGGMFKERFTPGALTFDDDVRLNVQHDRGRPIARTPATLALDDSDQRLEVRATPVLTGHARDAILMLRHGLLTGFSLEFLATKERYDGDVRVVEGARLVGIGLVDRPAYRDSEATIAVAERMASRRLAGTIGKTRRRRWL